VIREALNTTLAMFFYICVRTLARDHVRLEEKALGIAILLWLYTSSVLSVASGSHDKQIMCLIMDQHNYLEKKHALVVYN
jgi:hypothetical protein